MRYSFVTAAVLLGSALAVPHNKNKGSQCHHDDRFCHTTSSGAADPAVTATVDLFLTVTSPAGLNPSSPAANANHGSAASPLETSPEMPQPLAVDKHALSSAKADADQCEANTVTVTSQTTKTVTASPRDSADASSSLDLEAIAGTSLPILPTTTQSWRGPQPGINAPPADASKLDGSTVIKSSPTPGAGSEVGTKLQGGKQVSAAAEASSLAGAEPASSSTPAISRAVNPQPQAGDTNTGGLPFKTKRGIIASGNSMEKLAAAMGTGKVSWLGNWYSAPPHNLSPNLQFVPQNYGKGSDDKGIFTKNAQAEVDKGAKYLLSYGEPAAGTGANKVSPSTIADLFRKTMQPFADKGITVSSPTTLQTDGDFEWLESFLQACTDCSIGFLAIHYMNKYNSAVVRELKSTLNRAHDLAIKYNIPGGVWLDNFEVVGSVEQQKGFLQEVVPWLEEQDWIKAYAYVPDEVGKAGSGPDMVDASGALNELGQFYANM